MAMDRRQSATVRPLDPVSELLTVCIAVRDASVRSGGVGDAGGIVKPARRGSRGPGGDPMGHLIKALGPLKLLWGRAPLAMRPASRHDTLLAQDLDKMVQTISSSETGS